MKTIKKYTLTLLSITISLLLITLLLTTLYYFDYINTDTYKFLKITTLIITLIINSIVLGRSSSKNGYLDGIKLGIMLIIFCTLSSIINKNISIKLILYNLIILITATVGSMIGINTKRIEKEK